MRIKPLKEPNMGEFQDLIESYNIPLENAKTANLPIVSSITTIKDTLTAVNSGIPY